MSSGSEPFWGDYEEAQWIRLLPRSVLEGEDL